MVPSLSSSHRTEVYNPKTFFPHAALLGQGFPHCPIFPTAASRRSLDRVSVPVWPITLSGRLPIVGLVGRYLTNYLMGREPILHANKSFDLNNHAVSWSYAVLAVVSNCCPPLAGQVAHALLTRPPLSISNLPPEGFCLDNFVRLACVKHAASVRPEPGSNS